MLLALISFGSVAFAALSELLHPRRRLEFPALRRRFSNLAVWLFNLSVVAFLFTTHPPPLLEWPIADPALRFVTAFLLLDLLSYTVHRAQHAVPFLWRFHALHHSDPDVDLTTSVRHHPGEALLAGVIFWAIVTTAGVPIEAAAFHSTVVFAIAAATHTNTRWPAWTERLLRPVIITLETHLVHHSRNERELQSNYGAVLSLWDRLFGTFSRPAPATPVFGLAGLSRPGACCLSEILMTPWRLPMSATIHHLADDVEIETSVHIRAGRVIIRASLTDGRLVKETARRDYPYDANQLAADIEVFAREFEALVGFTVPRPFLQVTPPAPRSPRRASGSERLPREFASDHRIASARFTGEREFPHRPFG